MDISLAFKEAVQSIIFQHKNVQNIEQNNILNRIRKKNSFITLAELICNHINDLYKVVRESRETYLSLSNLLVNKCYMLNKNHDEIDCFTQTIANKCSKLIEELKGTLTYFGISQQNKEHNKIIIDIIEEHLKRVCKMHSEQKTMRTKKAVEFKQIFKLKSWKIETNKTNIHHHKHDAYNTKNCSSADQVNSFEVQDINGDIYQVINTEHELLKPKDIQLFEAENEQLYNELNTLAEEMKEIENKVAYISELQDIFSEKIIDQDKSLEHMLSTVVGSTENVKEANERIRNAIQRNAGFRVWILFFLLVLSFSLIFLDWYKP